jgi:hypothetical protein
MCPHSESATAIDTNRYASTVNVSNTGSRTSLPWQNDSLGGGAVGLIAGKGVGSAGALLGAVGCAVSCCVEMAQVVSDGSNVVNCLGCEFVCHAPWTPPTPPKPPSGARLMEHAHQRSTAPVAERAPRCLRTCAASTGALLFSCPAEGPGPGPRPGQCPSPRRRNRAQQQQLRVSAACGPAPRAPARCSSPALPKGRGQGRPGQCPSPRRRNRAR